MFGFGKKIQEPPLQTYEQLVAETNKREFDAYIQALYAKWDAETAARQKVLHQQAEDEIRRDNILYERTLSPEDNAHLVKMRYDHLWWFEGVLDDIDHAKSNAEYAKRDARDREDEKHRELMDRLSDVAATVERGNVAAKALDFAKDHPFLAGVIGADIVDKMKRR